MLDQDTVRAVDRAVSIIIAMSERENGMGVTELARTLGLHNTTASRLLGTLQRRGLVSQDRDSSRYRLGPAMVRLGHNAERSLDLGNIAVDEVCAFGRATGESVSLEAVDGDVLVRLASSDGWGNSRRYVGPNLPLHATAGGKLLLAHRPEREVMRMARSGLMSFTPSTIVRLDVLFRELATIRRRGWATVYGELDERINALAVPIFDQRGCAVAALEVAGPPIRISPSRSTELLKTAEEHAARIMELIGGLVPCTCDACASRSGGAAVDWARHSLMSAEQAKEIDEAIEDIDRPAADREPVAIEVTAGPACDRSSDLVLAER